MTHNTINTVLISLILVATLVGLDTLVSIKKDTANTLQLATSTACAVHNGSDTREFYMCMQDTLQDNNY